MARVNEIEAISKPEARSTHAKRPCTACYEPGVYLQVDTYASEEGRAVGDVKQAIRFDRAGPPACWNSSLSPFRTC